MKWFIDLNTRSKLFFTFGLLFVILLAVIVTAYSGFTGVQKSQSDLFHRDFMGATQLIELKADQNRTRADILEMMLTRDRAKQRSIDEDIKSRAKAIDDLMASVSDILKNEHDAETARKLEDLKTVRDAYRKTRDQQIGLIMSGRTDEARKLSVDVQEERYNKIRDIAVEIGNNELERAKARVARAESQARELQVTFLVASLLSFFFSVLTVFTLNKLIATPLKDVTLVAERIASGDLSVNIASDGRRDEVGALTRSFAKMTDYLCTVEAVAGKVASGDLTTTIKPQSEKDMLGKALGSMIDNLRAITKEIQESVSVLASSASEILSSTTEVASSVTETATSVNETTTTVEEVKQTAHVASQKAKYVSDASQNVVQISQSGGKAVDEAVEKINRIRQQMEFIAESVVRPERAEPGDRRDHRNGERSCGTVEPARGERLHRGREGGRTRKRICRGGPGGEKSRGAVEAGHGPGTEHPERHPEGNELGGAGNGTGKQDRGRGGQAVGAGRRGDQDPGAKRQRDRPGRDPDRRIEPAAARGDGPGHRRDE